MKALQLAALVVAACIAPTEAIWPFKKKRFEAEAFIDAGPLGMEAVTGRVVAVGDWDGDQKLDLFTLSEGSKTLQIHLWNRDSFRYVPSHTLSLSTPVSNVVPGDFNHDGHLDLLLMHTDESGGWWGEKKAKTGMQVYLGGGADGGFQEGSWTIPSSTGAQALVFDADGSLRPSLLAFEPPYPSGSGESLLKAWANNGSAFLVQAPPLQSPEQVCQLAHPHSSAFVDIDGDCLPDLVLHCERPGTKQRSIQIWLNKGSAGYSLARTYDLPAGSGPLSFADMDRDGTLDIVFPTCSRQSVASGIGSDCSINIAYNKQVPVCSGEEATHGADGALICRGWGELCGADESFDFDFTAGSEYFASAVISALFPSSTSNIELHLHPPGSPFIPLPVRPGDFNIDGFPDLLITIANSTAGAPPGGVFGTSRGAGTQVRVLENVPCGRGVAACDPKGSGRRGLRVSAGKGCEVLDEIWDASGASWIDIDDDGTLDILVQRSGDQTGEKITFIQNNIYHDAFFLKAQVLNGACDGNCQPADGGKKYSALGVSYSGATYKFTVLDTLGHRVAQQVAQLPQTSYHALHTPYSFIGLGRTNNYVERLFVGASLYPPAHLSTLESLIPNSQVIINPPAPISNSTEKGSAPVISRSSEWRSELFLHPGDWIPWVGAAVIGTVIVLGMVVIGLNEREKKEDEKERRRALHAINFQAL